MRLRTFYLFFALTFTTQLSYAQNPDSDYMSLLQRAKNMTYERDLNLKKTLDNPEKLKEYQKSTLQKLRKILRLDIEDICKQQPDIEITGKMKSGKFSVLKIIINEKISANVYLPNSIRKSPIPAVLLLPGHEIRGKGANTYQLTALTLAGNGIAVLIPDPVSHGERMQFINADGTNRNNRATTEHSQMEPGSVLINDNITREELIDNLILVNALFFNNN